MCASDIHYTTIVILSAVVATENCECKYKPIPIKFYHYKVI